MMAIIILLQTVWMENKNLYQKGGHLPANSRNYSIIPNLQSMTSNWQEFNAH